MTVTEQTSPAQTMPVRTAGLGPPSGKLNARWSWRGVIVVVILLLPALSLLAVAFFYPLAFTVGRSFDRGLDDYLWALQDPISQAVFLNTLFIAVIATIVCCVLAYPYAYLMTVVKPTTRVIMLAALLIPFWTSALIRAFALVIVLQPKGALNWLLGFVEIPPVEILGTTAAVLIGMCQMMLPFALLPMYSVMAKIDRKVVTAAESLGARPARAFFDTYVPQSLPGVLVGGALVFILSLGFYITPAILGSPRDAMVSVLITTQVQSLGDWSRGATLGVLLLAITLIIFGIGAFLVRPLFKWRKRS